MTNKLSIAQIPHPSWSVVVATDVGVERDHNEDAYALERFGTDILVGVFDGMGGHAGGDVASQTAGEMCVKHFERFAADTAPKSVMDDALVDVNHYLVDVGQNQPKYQGLGTTAVLGWLQGPAAWIAHVGDSRAYHFSRGELLFQTQDHTKVRRMVEAGILTPEEAADHPDANVVTRALGHLPQESSDPNRRPEVHPTPLIFQDGDLLLLCSDGLFDLVNESEMLQILARHPLEQALETLIEEAKARGGHDNITVALACYGETVNWASQDLAPIASPPPAEMPAPTPAIAIADEAPSSATHSSQVITGAPKSSEQPSKRLLQLIALSSIGAGVLGAIIGVIVFQFMSDMNAAQPTPKAPAAASVNENATPTPGTPNEPAESTAPSQSQPATESASPEAKQALPTAEPLDEQADDTPQAQESPSPVKPTPDQAKPAQKAKPKSTKAKPKAKSNKRKRSTVRKASDVNAKPAKAAPPPEAPKAPASPQTAPTPTPQPESPAPDPSPTTTQGSAEDKAPPAPEAK